MNNRNSQLLFFIVLFLGGIGAVLFFSTRDEPSAVIEQNTFQNKSVPGLITHKDEKSWDGFTLFGESGSELVRLVNMSGETVHRWNFDAARTRLLPSCNVLAVHGTKWGWSTKKWSTERVFVREFTWEGEEVWEHEVPGPAHHDVHRLDNGNTLILYRGEVPKSVRDNLENRDLANARIRTDSIREVSPGGEIVWEWHAHEHLDLTSCGKNPCAPLPKAMVQGRRVFDWTHTNSIYPLRDNKHYRAGDKRFAPGNILLTVRQWSTVLLISRESGEVVWSFDREMSGGHEGVMIEEPLRGAGNILIFNNGRDVLASSILEIDPLTLNTVWDFRDGDRFFSRAAGVSQRLPNGNTLISEDVPGRIFEITPSGERVWEYHAGLRTARARRYPQNHCPNLSNLPLHR